MRNQKDSGRFIFDILIVDDVHANLKVLGDILKGEGYKVRPALNGHQALQAAEKEKPDLILLDIMMPEMNGYEVCRRLKEIPEMSDIPVIFISALNGTEDIVKAFSSGGIDYITKPFKSEEVRKRVSTHLMVSWQSRELKRLNAEKDKFISIIAHDLRGPMGGIMGLAQIMADETRSYSDKAKKEMSATLHKTAINVYNLLEQLLNWSKIASGHIDYNPQKLILKDHVNKILGIFSETSREKSITLNSEIDEGLRVNADHDMLETILRNLISNAIKFTKSGGSVSVSTGSGEKGMVYVTVKDTGIGMSNEIIDNIFRIDVNTKRPGTNGELSTGMGLLLCQGFIEKHGGKLKISSEEGKGSEFTFTIPDSDEK
jgi:two-component system, sensor histidine kinase and response regulator